MMCSISKVFNFWSFSFLKKYQLMKMRMHYQESKSSQRDSKELGDNKRTVEPGHFYPASLLLSINLLSGF